MPKRVNKAIELLEQDQPVYLSIHYAIPPDRPFEAGVEAAKWCVDLIDVDLERSYFDVRVVGEFMRGLAAGGPTASGHRTPAVYVTLPIEGSDEASVRANAWMIWQILNTGVHGLMLCQAESEDAVRAYVEIARHTFVTIGVGQGLGEGRRGTSAQANAARIWGIPTEEYIYKADPWPLNPDGELLLGLKLENRRAADNALAITSVPGIGFVEWGPGDMSWSMGLVGCERNPYPPQLLEARAKIFAAAKANKLAFLESAKPENVCAMIDEGIRVFCSGSQLQQISEIGRRYTGRTMP